MRLFFDCKYLDIVLFLSECFLIHEENISHSYLYDEKALKSLLLFDFDRNLTVKYGMFRCVKIAVVHATGEAPVVKSQVCFDKLLIIPIFQTKAS